MSRLGAVIAEAIIHQYWARRVVAPARHLFWFQAFDAVIGTDWHSSGITLGRGEELNAIQRLDAQAMLLEQYASGFSIEALIAQEGIGRRRWGVDLCWDGCARLPATYGWRRVLSMRRSGMNHISATST